MDRRSLLATLTGYSRSPFGETTSSLAPDSGLEPYSGEWRFEQAAHLLRRAMFGPSYEQIKWAAEQGLAATVDQLLKDAPIPAPPVNVEYAKDPTVPKGATWINAPYSDNPDRRNEELIYREKSLDAWVLGLILDEGMSIREKLVLFWHNHFPINRADVVDAKFLYRNNSILRRHALGNFRTLTKEITIDPGMLMYLNGDQNTKDAPNENYARELLELFTIGKGKITAPGDYTNYTEHDVREIARALTGWKAFGYVEDSQDGTFSAVYSSNWHDTESKQLSARFDNAVINNMTDQEYGEVIDVIFKKNEVARFICRKLYRWFVYYQIDEAIELNVIQPMAQIMIDSNYEVKPALQALLSSQHFFAPANLGAMIKNPIDFIMSAIKPLKAELSNAPDQRANVLFALFDYCKVFQMEYFSVPEVAGWKAYYQEPTYYRNWVNATTLPSRMNWTDDFVINDLVLPEGEGRINLDMLKIVALLDDPRDPNSVVKELARILFSQPISDAQITALKGILLPGLPDFEWTVEYGKYTDNPANSDLAKALETKLQALVKTMFNMSEFYLC